MVSKTSKSEMLLTVSGVMADNLPRN